MQGQIFNLEVNPRVPVALERLPELAMNLRFTWHRPTRALFASLDRRLFLDLHSNPKLFLRCVDQRRLDQAAMDPAFLEEYQRVLARFDAYQERSEHFHGETLPATDLVAYFCAEFGFHESLPMYSGGLGVLAGDHCKTASDLNMNFVGVGLLYRRGYFTQEIDNAGQQHSVFKDIDHEDLPVELVRDAAGAPLEIAIPVADRTVWAQLWKAQVGRVRVYLLDANVARNSESDRHITHALYAGDHDRRIQQEMVLGIGGVRALRALGLAPAVWHINEGHAAFLTLELTAELVEQGLDIDTAREAAAASVVFTTHTPVAAGHDAFDPPMVAGYFRDYIRRLGLDEAGFAALGRGADGRFNMTRLAINLSRHHNGVSRLHGEISARICADAWPEVPPEDNPMGYVTNGVHVPTFLFQYWKDLFDMSLGEAWRTREDDPAFWTRLAQIPDEIFIDIKRAVKAEMMRAVRIRLERVCARNGVGESHLARMSRFLNPDNPSPLVIGFARRFATYKRAALLLRDLAWLKQIACHPERPVVFVFAGKAHPQDVPAQQVIREVIGAAGDPELVGHVVFVEDYDLGLARSLIAGVDVWLNTPVSPLEASGTSGIKAAINGTLNLSVLDGWWAEGHADDNGWALPPSRAADPGRRDAEDAQALYELLQDTVVPMYYTRDERGVPREWVRRMKQSIMTILPAFNMRRVLLDYANGSYGPAASEARLLAADGYAAAHALAAWKRRVRAAWSGVRAQVLTAPAMHVAFDGRVQARVAVHTGGLGPDDLRVELLLSRLVPDGTGEQPRLASHRGALAPIRVRNGHATACVQLACTGERLEDGGWVFATDGAPPWCGKLQAALRVTPHHRLLAHPHELGLMRWL